MPRITTSNSIVTDDMLIEGNLTVEGNTTTIQTTNLSIDDKNITMGEVAAINGLVTTTNLVTNNAVVIIDSTSGLIPGMTATEAGSNTGSFATANSGVRTILSVDSKTQITLDANHSAAGAITFNVGTATDVTADGGGITLKGASDKTIIWKNDTDAWEVNNSFYPSVTDGSLDLGSASQRWGNVFTMDLHLANERGDWTLVEEANYLTVRNNKNGKRYKLLMEELPEEGD